MSTLRVVAEAVAKLTQRIRQLEVREHPGAAGDPDAIHDNVAGEIAAIAPKVAPIATDLLVIEDSAVGNVKKSLQIGNLPGGADPNAIHVNVANEISGIVEKVAPINADLLVIEDSAAGHVKKKVQMVNLPGGADPNAIHVNVPGEIAGIAPKVAPIAADLIVIEDSAAANAKKSVQIGNLPGGADPNAIHVNAANEISGIAEKVAPINADLLVIEDSAAGNIKKRVQIGNLPAGAGVTDVLMVQVFS